MRQNMAKRVAHRYMKQASDAYEAAVRMFEKGEAPDSDPWHGGPVELRVDYTSPKLEDGKKKKVSEDRYRFNATLRYTSSSYSTGGVYSNSGLLKRFLEAYPGSENVLQDVFMEQVKKNLSDLKQQIKAYYEKFSDRLPAKSGLIDYADVDEWEDVKLEKVDVGIDPNPNEISRFGDVSTDFVSVVQFTARKKEPVTERPFDDMSNSELNELIEAVVGPSQFWMDGEYQGTKRQRLKDLRKRFREFSPRRQKQTLEQYKRRW